MKTIFDVLSTAQSRPERVTLLFHSLQRILLNNEEAIHVWQKFNGFREIMNTISNLHIFFSPSLASSGTSNSAGDGGDKESKKGDDVDDNQESPTHSNSSAYFQEGYAVDCLQAALECVSLEFSLDDMYESDRKKMATQRRYDIVMAIRRSQILTSQYSLDAVYLLVDLMGGFSWKTSNNGSTGAGAEEVRDTPSGNEQSTRIDDSDQPNSAKGGSSNEHDGNASPVKDVRDNLSPLSLPSSSEQEMKMAIDDIYHNYPIVNPEIALVLLGTYPALISTPNLITSSIYVVLCIEVHI